MTRRDPSCTETIRSKFFANQPAFAFDTANPFEGKGPAPSVRAWSQRDYGNRIGIWRIMEVLTKHASAHRPPSTATSASTIRDHQECVKLGWELLGHNKKNSERLNAVPPDRSAR